MFRVFHTLHCVSVKLLCIFRAVGAFNTGPISQGTSVFLITNKIYTVYTTASISNDNNFRTTEWTCITFRAIMHDNVPVKLLQFPSTAFSCTVRGRINDRIQWPSLVKQRSAILSMSLAVRTSNIPLCTSNFQYIYMNKK